MEPIEAVTKLPQLNPDILFLDIQMPQLTGLEFLQSLNQIPLVIVTTAYREYAAESYDLNVLDYLMKPIPFPRFLKAVSKAFESNGRKLTIQESDIVIESQSTPENDFIYLKVDKMMEKILLKDILYVESLKNYVRMKTISRELITYQTLSQMEEKLPIGKFFRIHRSFIIALNKVEKYSSNEVNVAGKLISIGGNYKEHFLQRISV